MRKNVAPFMIIQNVFIIIPQATIPFMFKSFIHIHSSIQWYLYKTIDDTLYTYSHIYYYKIYTVLYYKNHRGHSLKIIVRVHWHAATCLIKHGLGEKNAWTNSDITLWKSTICSNVIWNVQTYCFQIFLNFF